MTSARVDQALERLSEDGALTGNLTDPEATEVLAWAEGQIVAADAAGDDNVFESRVAAVRAAVRAAARSADDAAPVVERAERRLRGVVVEPSVVSPAAGVESVAAPPVEQRPSSATALLSAPPRRSLWGRLQRKIQRWTHRKAL